MNSIKRKTIFSQLITAFLPLALLPLALVIVFFYWQAKSLLETSAINSLRSLSVVHSNIINHFVEGLTKDVVQLSRTPIIKNHFSDLAETKLRISQHQDVENKLQEFLEEYLYNKNYHNAFLISESGDIFFSATKGDDLDTNLLTGKYQSSQLAKVFKKASRWLQTEISEFEPYRPDQNPSGFIAAPIIKNKKLIGVVALQIKNETLYSFIQNLTGLGKTSEILTGSLDGNEVVFMSPLRYKSDSTIEKKVRLGSPHAKPLQQAVQKIHGYGASVDYRGKKVIAVWNYLPSIRWGVVAKIDEDEIFSPIATFRKFSIFMGMISIFVVLVMIFIMAKRLTHPIVQLKAWTQKVAAGNYSESIDINSNNELGDLSDSFKTMQINLNASYNKLRHEIEERVKIEKTLLQTQNDLERRVAEKTFEYKNATNKAEAANRAKSDFLARMSHELRTPLNGIIGFAQVLLMSKKEPLSLRQKEDMEQIKESGHHLLNLINEILDLSKIEVDKMPITLEKVNVNEVSTQAINLVQPLAQKFNIRLENVLANETHSIVIADYTRLKQVLINLLSNAIKYNKPDGLVKITTLIESNDHLRINFQDTGPGIAKEKIDQLFQPFNRIGAEYSTIEGAGIGLAITKKLVKLMNGEIGVESILGQGSCFYIIIPLSQEE